MKQIILALGIMALAAPLAAPLAANPAATDALNQLRASQGMAAVSYNKKLEKAATVHLNDMIRNDFFDHRGSNGSTVGKRVKRAGYRFCYASENIAWGQRDLATVMKVWTNSPSHYKNMVNRKAKEFALVRGEGNMWVMVLGSRRCR